MCECIQFFKAIFDCKKCIQCDIVKPKLLNSKTFNKDCINLNNINDKN